MASESSALLPSFDLTVPARLVTQTVHEKGSFWRTAQWSPDGASILAHGEDRSLDLFTVPDAIISTPTAPASLELTRSFASASALLCTQWFPSATSQSPEIYCFMRSQRDTPVHLVDGNTGKVCPLPIDAWIGSPRNQVRASYPIIDHIERFVGPNAMTFAADGRKLYCGHENAIEIFDVASPGEEGFRLPTCPSRRSKDGQRGIISSLDISLHDPSQLVAGSFASTVGLYDLDAERLMHVWPVPSGGGVTQAAFHPASPHTVVVASRHSEVVLLYDTRNTSVAYGELNRGPSRTNQRMQFSIDREGKLLAAGCTDGSFRIFSFENDSAEPLLTSLAGDASIGAADLHPYLPLLLTVCGSRSFSWSDSDSSDDDEGDVVGTLGVWQLGAQNGIA